MDKIAIISDVHGNIPALEAVLADIRKRGIDLIYNLGDLVGKGARSDLAIDRCREVCQVIVRGNWDDSLLKPADNPDATWYQEQIGEERLKYLGTLANVCDFWMSGKRIRLYHASEQSLYKRIHPWHPAETHRAMFQNTYFTGFEYQEPDIVGYGDIHAAYLLPLRDGPEMLFNAGSVGNPLDMPLASYCILSGKLESKAAGLFSIDFVRVPYDIDSEVEEGRRVGLPQLEAYEIELREAIYRGAQKPKTN